MAREVIGTGKVLRYTGLVKVTVKGKVVYFPRR